jgi:septum formation protein
VTRPPLLLASASPRRLELLRALGLEPLVCPADVDETLRPGEDPHEAAERLARAKAAAVAQGAPTGAVVLAADTIVVLDGEALGKPRDRADARRMLHALRGRAHDVVTGVALARDGRLVSGRETTEVLFAPMTDEEVDAYVASGEPSDKAGAYALQGLGGLFVERITGTPSNVIGLPFRLVRRLGSEVGLQI